MPTDIALELQAAQAANRQPASELSSLTDDELQARINAVQAAMQEDEGSYGVGTALDVMGYQPGVAMSGIYNTLVNKGKVPPALAEQIREQEARAFKLKGPFPEATKYLEAAGYPIKNDMAKIAVNIAAPTALDVATYTPLGIGTATGRVLNKLARPLASWAGKRIFESAPAIRRANVALKDLGKGPITEDLLNAGKYGTAAQLERSTVKLARESQKAADDMIKEVTTAGGKVPTKIVTKGPAADMATEYAVANDPQMRELGEAMKDYLSKVANMGETVSPSEATFIKGFHAKKGTYAQYKDNPVWVDFQRKLANSYREGVEQAATKTLGSNAGEKLAAQNAKTGRLLNARQPISKQSGTDMGRSWMKLSPLDMSLLASALYPSARKYTMPLFIGKKASEGLANTLPRTLIGQSLYGGAKELAPLYPAAKHGFRLLGNEMREE